jgi:serine/threonine protein kinase
VSGRVLLTLGSRGADIKPGNILLAQPTGKSESCAVKLIDLGGAADLNSQLRDGEAIFDPTYGGPEQFNLVKGCVQRAKRGS